MRISGRLLLTACAVAVAVAAVWGGLDAAHDPTARGAPPRPAAVLDARHVGAMQAVSALAVLRDWDRARASAWAHGDRAALRRLYAAGSTAGRHDVAMLDRWTRRGLRVRGMSMQVLGVRLRARTRHRVVLVVTDRLVGAYAVTRGRRVALPRDNASTRRLEFRRVDGRWLMASVRQAS
ncbi:MAG: hypothetical protein FWE71_02485 [Nocardioidaceae bacterium]|nr:hypothetical protein [Nocardioidaceae bacterium]MCL2611654.1 hypothetical protein [Nocardioidaceae bacterium]